MRSLNQRPRRTLMFWIFTETEMLHMRAQSKAQQKAAGAALAAKRGETKVSDLQGASKEMYDSMSEAELEEMASTNHDGLPETKED